MSGTLEGHGCSSFSSAVLEVGGTVTKLELRCTGHTALGAGAPEGCPNVLAQAFLFPLSFMFTPREPRTLLTAPPAPGKCTAGLCPHRPLEPRTEGRAGRRCAPPTKLAPLVSATSFFSFPNLVPEHVPWLVGTYAVCQGLLMGLPSCPPLDTLRVKTGWSSGGESCGYIHAQKTPNLFSACEALQIQPCLFSPNSGPEPTPRSCGSSPCGLLSELQGESSIPLVGPSLSLSRVLIFTSVCAAVIQIW